MTQLDVLKDISEIIHYNIEDYPFYFSYGDLNHFPEMRALCHWHDDLEYVHVLKGHMSYSVNGKDFTLQEGEAILINSRQLHYGYSSDGTNCEYCCILFHPDLLAVNTYLKDKFIRPVTSHPAFNQLILSPDSSDSSIRQMFDLYQELQTVMEDKLPGYELQIQSLLPSIWLELYHKLSQTAADAAAPNKELKAQHDMIDHIHHHYQEKMSLEDIARAGGVCRNRCCSIFKNYLHQSPMNFLNQYRLEQGVSLLNSSQATVTEIALSCGFAGSSYFTELFRQYKGCTPTEYRRLTRATRPNIRREASDQKSE